MIKAIVRSTVSRALSFSKKERAYHGYCENFREVSYFSHIVSHCKTFQVSDIVKQCYVECNDAPWTLVRDAVFLSTDVLVS